MKVSFNACVLRHVRRKDNTFPVYIRIGFQSKYDFLLTNFVAGKSDLTKELKIKSNLILGKCAQIISEYESRLEKLKHEPRDVKEIAEWVQRTDIDGELDFLAFFKNRLKTWKKGNIPVPGYIKPPITI